MNSVALVTCKVLPEPDPDAEPLLEALRRVGLRAEMLAWDDPNGNPGALDLCVLRSCWDYHEHPEAFLAWIARCAAVTRLVNPADIVHWNLHKRYLHELESAGVPIIPTAFFEQGAVADLGTTMRERGWNDVVIKPAVSAASFMTRRYHGEQQVEGQQFLATLVAERDAMVQCYMPAVEDSGERALVWIDGELTHAVRKSPRFADDDEHVSAALPVTDREKAIAERALARVAGELLYARVDVVADRDDRLVVSELELIEPSLFLLQCPAAQERLVGAIARLLHRSA